MFKFMLGNASEAEEEEFQSLEDSMREMSFLKADSDRANATCKKISEELSQTDGSPTVTAQNTA